MSAGARVSGRARTAGEASRRPGEKGAGWGGTPPETSALWNGFLSLMSEDLVGIPDGDTLAALETVVETEGLPKMPDGTAIGGRLLALLLALRGTAEHHRIATSEQVVRFVPQKDPENADLWSLNMRN